MSPFGLKFSQMTLHTETSKIMCNWSFHFEVLHKPTLLPSTFNIFCRDHLAWSQVLCKENKTKATCKCDMFIAWELIHKTSWIMQCLAIPLVSMQVLFEVMRALFFYILDIKKILKKKKVTCCMFCGHVASCKTLIHSRPVTHNAIDQWFANHQMQWWLLKAILTYGIRITNNKT